VNFSDGTKSGGCFSKGGSEMRGSDGMWQRSQYCSGRVVLTGCTFAAFLYLAAAKASKGSPTCGRGLPKGLDLLGSGGFLGSGDFFGRFDLIRGRPDRWQAWAKISVVLREWRCAN